MKTLAVLAVVGAALSASTADAGRFYLEMNAGVLGDVKVYNTKGEMVKHRTEYHMGDAEDPYIHSGTDLEYGTTFEFKSDAWDWTNLDYNETFKVVFTPKLAQYGPTTWYINENTNMTVHIHGTVFELFHNEWVSNSYFPVDGGAD